MLDDEKELYKESLLQGLKLAEYRMLRDKAIRNLTIIQGDGNTGFREVSARVIFTQIYQEPIPSF